MKSYYKITPKGFDIYCNDIRNGSARGAQAALLDTLCWFCCYDIRGNLVSSGPIALDSIMLIDRYLQDTYSKKILRDIKRRLVHNKYIVRVAKAEVVLLSLKGALD